MVEKMVVEGPQAAQTRNEHEQVLVRRAEQVSILSWQLPQVEARASSGHSQVLPMEVQESISTFGEELLAGLVSCLSSPGPKVAQGTWGVVRVVGKAPVQEHHLRLAVLRCGD